MAASPANDPIAHLSTMIAQLVRQNQTLIGQIDRVATSVGDLAKDMRLGFRNAQTESDRLRTEMNERFRAVGTRFDDLEERMTRVEDGLRQVHSDLLRLENGVLDAQQTALQAHLRLDESARGGEEPSS